MKGENLVLPRLPCFVFALQNFGFALALKHFLGESQASGGDEREEDVLDSGVHSYKPVKEGEREERGGVREIVLRLELEQPLVDLGPVVLGDFVGHLRVTCLWELSSQAYFGVYHGLVFVYI